MDLNLEKGVVSETPESTKAIAASIAEMLGYRGCIALSGDMGAGKTVFAKGLAEALGISVPVKSPSYNVYLTYEGPRGNFVHIDAYRLNRAEDFEALLIDEIVGDPKLVCVEWPQIVSNALPPDAMRIEIAMSPGSDLRIIKKI